ncbi:histone deacetylase [Flavobacterium sp. F-380]|uniref:Histone deacetylase n=1 Tax=Flavobacterium kayseriense TaxID=2764714 RepID=A0ABR7J4Z1_9FLAO|nr:histone deacetylase [Flavobacterium kayseriense]MBC5840620.1 histone deacetylase [Flavobacterium kayseriense]MBC5846710.1 histone deacetylase [Flavobacterium kayseriense]MBU0942702.1 histone deacetylase [Bacteroidota bacterium]
MFPIAFHPIYQHPLPEGHRFPMLKYELLPQQLLHEGTATQTDFFEPELCDLTPVLAIHNKGYVNDLLQLTLNAKAARKIGFPLSNELVQRELIIAQGTITGAQKSFDTKVSFNIAGGTHHAYSTHGEAFCLLNDQAIAARFLLDQKLAKKILIIDLDVHQGNGTAQIFQNNKDVFTFSTHGKTNYPFKKETSDLDIAFDDGTTDSQFLSTIASVIPQLIETQKPNFIFYLAGVDILASDKLGKLGCTLDGCKKRDELVFELCSKHQIPVQVSMGGGYSPNIKTIIEAHANTFRAAKDIF